MDKIFDAVLKILPSYVLIATTAVVVSLLSVYNWRGYRTYSDVVRDRLFLSLLITIIASSAIYALHQQKPTSKQTILVIIPYFKNDESDQFRTAVGTQIEAALSTLFNKDHGVQYVNSFLVDEQSARETATRYGAVAVLHGPTVIRDGDDTRCSFRLTIFDPELTKTYPLVPIQVSKNILDDIALTIASGTGAGKRASASVNPILSRLETLEKSLSQLQTTLASVPSATLSNNIPRYAAKRALVVGVNGSRNSPWPRLAAAESDADSISKSLQQLGFTVTHLSGSDATTSRVAEEFRRLRSQGSDGDLFVFYFAGHSTILDEAPKVLHLVMYDAASDNIRNQLDLRELKAELESVPALHRLAILDAVNGTTGLSPSAVPPRNPQDPVIQFLAGCQDDQFGSENAQGGVFTQNFLAALHQSGGRGVWLDDLVGQASERMENQQPKLLRVDGTGRIFLASI
jgi:hypothetical protein